MRYRRYYRAGGTYFFTVVAHNRQRILTGDAVRSALREAVLAVREKYPFEIAAWVLMPDHLHTCVPSAPTRCRNLLNRVHGLRRTPYL
ncbi:transposase [Neisseria weaveri]|uniref:transposase n=1 Tax=Neisseria weaveri TaxID=28091 RepID=UPI002277C2F5|nr:transposase [Neisseria weaveri]